jgi:hypothetical protein
VVTDSAGRDRYVHLTDRSTFMIISGGVNVYRSRSAPKAAAGDRPELARTRAYANVSYSAGRDGRQVSSKAIGNGKTRSRP